MTALFVIVFILCYLTGSIPWGLLIARSKGIDIRREGSGNIGATNVNRVLGKKWGRFCFLLDFLKGFVPVLIVRLLEVHHVIPQSGGWLVAVAVFGCVSGHIWSIFLRFKGGKGIATSAGALMVVTPLSVFVSGIIWVFVFFSSRYVSLASIAAAFFLPVSAIVFSNAEIWPLPDSILLLLSLIALIAVVKHSSNIKRLVNGTENRFVKKKLSDTASDSGQTENEKD